MSARTSPANSLHIVERRRPGIYDDIDTLTEKYIELGHDEDVALEMAADRCEDIDNGKESLQWD